MNKSKELFHKAKTLIAGGVNSPVRAFKAVGGEPLFIQKADGAYLFDADGKKYIDYVGSWGPAILGHNNEIVRNAILQQLPLGLSFGAPCELEVALAEQITKMMPSIEIIRMVNSGTEATMSAIRLARGFTGKDKIIKFEGCYHGHSDSLLVKAGSGALTNGSPSSLGVPLDFVKHTLSLPFNDLDALKNAFKEYPNQIAGIIVEPIAGNMNLVLPKEDFLQGLRNLCDEFGAVLIFDEVMTGFRASLGGAQEIYKVKPDLTTLGKIIGGGLPVGAFGGKAEIMAHLAPNGAVYQAGTLSGNPIAMASGLACLQKLTEPNLFNSIEEKTKKLCQLLQKAADENSIPFKAHSVGAMFGLFFTDKKELHNLDEVMGCNLEHFVKFFNLMLNQGIYLAPSAFEAGFVSLAHSDTDLTDTANSAKLAFSQLKP